MDHDYDYDVVDQESVISEERITELVTQLKRAFKSACYTYRNKTSGSVNYLLRSRKNHQPLETNSDTVLHEYQVEFAYLLDEITRGPIFAAPVAISSTWELISDLKAKCSQ